MIKSFKVYGADGHRQKQSFGKTEHFDFSTETELRKISIIRSDITKTNDYAIIEIEMASEKEIMAELDGQLSDGFFENVRTGKIEEVKRIVVRDREAGNIIEEVASFSDGLKLIQEYEKADMDNDEYTEDFYEVAAL